MEFSLRKDRKCRGAKEQICDGEKPKRTVGEERRKNTIHPASEKLVAWVLFLTIWKSDELTSFGLSVCSFQSGSCFVLPVFVEDTSQLCLDLVHIILVSV